MPSGKILKNLDGCKLENGAIIAFQYGDQTYVPKLKKSKPPSFTIPLPKEDTETQLPSEYTEVHQTQEIQKPKKQSNLTLIFVIVCAMLALAVAKYINKKSARALALSSQIKEREQKQCDTRSDKIIDNIQETVRHTESIKFQVQQPNWLYEKISKIMKEVSVLTKRIKKRVKNEKKSKI